MNISNTSAAGGPGEVSFDNLYPAILQVFAIILAGYIAGRFRLITSSQGKGIGTFVSNFCLPALLFKSMCELHFDRVNWVFLLSILLSKTIIFALVLFISLLVKRPVNLGYAGLFAIFATQSNDFALGYPLIKALYKDTRPDFLDYIYLFAPISLVILNPIGFILLEIDKRKSDKEARSSTFSMVLKVIRGVVTNPIVFMTFIGIIGNFVFSQKVPLILDDILTVLGNAFVASALFYLGLNLVGKVTGQSGNTFIVPVLLISAKTLLLPLISWEIIEALNAGGSDNETEQLSEFGFLYGTFPTAPTVFLYASQYGVAQDMIATGMVFCTFMSAPLMFVSAKMMTLVVNSEVDYKSLLMQTSFDVSIVSLICCVWVAGVLLLSRKFKRIPHQFLLCLVASQFLACLGMIIYQGMDSGSVWQHYLQFIILLVGVFSSRCWTSMIAVALCLMHTHSLCYVLRKRAWFYFYGFGVPVLSTGVLFLIGNNHMHDEVDPSFHYGIDQSILSAVILGINMIVTIVALIAQHRNHHRSAYAYQRLPTSESNDAPSRVTANGRLNGHVNSIVKKKKVCKKRNGTKDASCDNCTTCPDTIKSIEDIIPFPNETESLLASTESSSTDTFDEHTCLMPTCNRDQRRECSQLLQSYTDIISTPPDPEIEISQPFKRMQSDPQATRHTILLLLLIVSMFTGFCLCVWRMFQRKTSGIYIEIEFLDSVFNYGQGFLSFAVFGMDTQLIIIPFLKRWRRLFYGVEVVHVPEEVDEETKHVCDQFVRFHRASCKRNIVKTRRYRLREYCSVFSGSEMCRWLEEVGLARDAGEAVKYGRTLLIGKVIHHVSHEHHFHDMPYFYRFTEDDQELIDEDENSDHDK